MRLLLSWPRSERRSTGAYVDRALTVHAPGAAKALLLACIAWPRLYGPPMRRIGCAAIVAGSALVQWSLGVVWFDPGREGIPIRGWETSPAQLAALACAVAGGLALVAAVRPATAERVPVGRVSARLLRRARWLSKRQSRPFRRLRKAAGQGLEPQLPVPETGVLPLDDPARAGGIVAASSSAVGPTSRAGRSGRGASPPRCRCARPPRRTAPAPSRAASPSGGRPPGRSRGGCSSGSRC